MNFRVVFVLVDLLEFSYEDVVQILGVPMGTVMSRLYSGRTDLAENAKIIDMALPYGIKSNLEGKRRKSKVRER